MSSHVKLALAISTVFAASSFAGVALAQQPAWSPPASGPAASPAPHQAPGSRLRDHRGPRALIAGLMRLSPADRTAVLDARLAGLKAGLELNADQQKNWQPFETAVRNGVDQAVKMRDEFAQEGQPKDPMERLERISQRASARAAWLKSFVDAAKPLYDSLTPEQKARAPLLIGVVGEIGRAPPAARTPRAGQERGPMQRGGERRMERQHMMMNGGDENGPQEDWRSRMRQRMEQMNRNRQEWRQGWRGDRYYNRGSGYNGEGQGDQNDSDGDGD